MTLVLTFFLLNTAFAVDGPPKPRSCCQRASVNSQLREETSPVPGVKPEAARSLFEAFKKMQGTWKGTSTKGWTEEVSIRVIAGGSVVQFTSFDAHPNETMQTMIHMDIDRLVLTHYCVARNQPRLELTEISDDGTRAVFTFLDATNLPSRDQGHMDKVVYHFTDSTSFSSQWTWYQNGTERWLEEINLQRNPL